MSHALKSLPERRRLGSVRELSLEIRQFPGGHSNLTYLVRYGPDEFVLRRPPVGPVAPTAHDMPREYKLLSVIHPLFHLAPKPILLCEDAGRYRRPVLFDGTAARLHRSIGTPPGN